MARLLLVLGSRGAPVADLVRSLSAVADVAVLTSRDVLAERVDAVPIGTAAIIAAERGAMVAAAVQHPICAGLDGVVSLTEDTVEIAADLAERLGLPGQPTATMPALSDKLLQRDALSAAGVPGPPYARIAAAGDVVEALSAVPLPAVLKPARGSGGALVRMVDTPAALVDVVLEALSSRAQAGGAVAADTALILESRLVGVRDDVAGLASYVSVETLATRGVYHHLCVTDRFPLAPPALETGMVLPSSLGSHEQRDVIAMAERALAALGFQHGAAHTELMLTADGPRIVEVNSRLGGAIPFLLPIAAGYDVVAQLGRIALGQPPERPRFTGRFAVFVAPQHRVAATVAGVAGLDRTGSIPGVRAVIPIATRAGTSTAADRHTLVAAVLAEAGSAAEAVRIHRLVCNTITPSYV